MFGPDGQKGVTVWLESCILATAMEWSVRCLGFTALNIVYFFYVFDVTGVDEDTRPAKTVCDEIKAHALSLAIDRQHQPLKCIEVYICLTRVYIEDV